MSPRTSIIATCCSSTPCISTSHSSRSPDSSESFMSPTSTAREPSSTRTSPKSRRQAGTKSAAGSANVLIAAAPGRCRSRAPARAHLLRLAVVRLVVAGGQRVRPEHDAPLGLVAEALVPRALVQLGQVVVDVGAVAVADAVVACKVGRGLGGRDQVVARQPVLDRSRQAAFGHVCSELGAEIDRALDGFADSGLDALRLVQFGRDADAHALQI